MTRTSSVLPSPGWLPSSNTTGLPLMIKCNNQDTGDQHRNGIGDVCILLEREISQQLVQVGRQAVNGGNALVHGFGNRRFDVEAMDQDAHFGVPPGSRSTKSGSKTGRRA